MAIESPAEVFLCPILQKKMQDPVVAADGKNIYIFTLNIVY